jgi:ABC-type branched-subunit amino acid transport system substrate-binding protein
MKERLLKELGIELVVDETFTPPLADATPLVQKVRAARPDLLFFLPTVISDAKLVMEKMNEFGMGQGKVPVISFGIAIAEPDMLRTMSPELLQGVMSAVGSWGSKGHEDLMAELKTKYNEPWMTQNAISTYADMWVIKDALEKAGQGRPRGGGQALRTMDGGPSKFYPAGLIKFDDKGRRVDAGLTIIQWQSGVPVTVYPDNLALPRRSGEEVGLRFAGARFQGRASLEPGPCADSGRSLRRGVMLAQAGIHARAGLHRLARISAFAEMTRGQGENPETEDVDGQTDIRTRLEIRNRCSARSSSRSRSPRPTTSIGRCRSW